MKIVFIYENMYAMGGIQTWLSRVLPRLRARGHDVALLTRARGEAWDSSSAFVDQLVAQGIGVHRGGRHWFDAPGEEDPPIGAAHVLFACHVPALLRAALIQQRVAPSARIVAGVFHPNEYRFDVALLERRLRELLGRRLARGLPPQNFVFATESMRRLTGAHLGIDLRRSPVLPLPVDTERFRPPAARRVDRHKIVSVTRLAANYTHHAQMIRVVRDLRDRGHAFAYHAYGDGDQRRALEAQARSLEVDDAVFFHGTVPYDRLHEAVGDAFAYIGFGTALLEAAACGVPALVGIDPHPGPATYGFIHETEGNELGGYLPGQRQYAIDERLLWLAERSEHEYRGVERASRARAEQFSVDLLVPRLERILESAAPARLRVPLGGRAAGRLDWLLHAALLRAGSRDAMAERYVRDDA